MRACVIEGLRCESVFRSGEGYLLHFDPEHVTLEQLVAANWAEPVVEHNQSMLPDGYGYELAGITYNHCDKIWKVSLKVARKYLGNIEAYTAQVAELQETVATRDAQMRDLNGQLAEADELAISLYEQLAEADELAISLYEQLGNQ